MLHTIYIHYILYILLLYRYSIAVESTSLLLEVPCGPGECKWIDYPIECCIERLPFLILLSALFILHCIWFKLLLKKGFRELFGSGEREKSVDETKKK